jgi:hypothetical protein
MIFSVVLSWLGGFFCGGFFCGGFFCDGFFCGGFAVFSYMLWWLGIFMMCFHGWAVFFYGAAVFFCAFDGACFAAIGFFCFFGGDSGLMSISWLELAPPELNDGSCVDGE